jgi:hypothetical protein
MPFLMMSSKLGHKSTNVKRARINKLLITFVHRITLRKHIYSATVYAKSVYSIVPQLAYVVQFFMLFPAMYSKLRHKLVNIKIARINKCQLLCLHILLNVRLENLVNGKVMEKCVTMATITSMTPNVDDRQFLFY